MAVAGLLMQMPLLAKEVSHVWLWVASSSLRFWLAVVAVPAAEEHLLQQWSMEG